MGVLIVDEADQVLVLRRTLSIGKEAHRVLRFYECSWIFPLLRLVDPSVVLRQREVHQRTLDKRRTLHFSVPIHNAVFLVRTRTVGVGVLLKALCGLLKTMPPTRRGSSKDDLRLAHGHPLVTSVILRCASDVNLLGLDDMDVLETVPRPRARDGHRPLTLPPKCHYCLVGSIRMDRSHAS